MESIDYALLTNEVIEKLKSLNSNDNILVAKILDDISHGQNLITSKIIESSHLIDAEWFEVISNYLESLKHVVYDPKTLIIDDAVAIQKVENDIVPGLYEKRFIKTLILELESFLEKRYKDVPGKQEQFKKNKIDFSSDFIHGADEVKCSISLEIKTQEEKEEDEMSAYKLKMSADLLKEVKSLRNSRFMEVFKEEAVISDNVMKTNSIISNKDYLNCYLMWLYLDRYKENEELPIKEKYNSLADSYKEDLIYLVMLSYIIDLEHNAEKQEEEVFDFDFKKIAEEKALNVSVFESLDTAIDTESVEDKIKKRAEDLFIKYTDEGFSDKRSYKKMFKNLLELATNTYRDLHSIPDESESTFKDLVFGDEKSLLDNYNSKIKALNDILIVKKQDIIKLQKHISKMKQNVTNYKKELKERKAKEKEQLKEVKRLQLEKQKQELKAEKERIKALEKKALEKAKAKELKKKQNQKKKNLKKNIKKKTEK